MSSLAQNISGFGPLLRHWRKHRRLSQLDLALNSEVSQRHLSFLESGRAKPSRQMVLQLSESLDLPLRERNHLLTSAGFHAAFSWRGLSQEEMKPVRQALDLLLTHHEPYPAVVVDSDWNLVSSNAALPRLFSLLGDMPQVWSKVCPDGKPNVLKLTFHPDGLRPYIENFVEFAAHVINRTHREAAAHPAVAELLNEIMDYPDLPARWRFPDYSVDTSPLLTMRLRKDDLRLAMFSTITTFGTPQDVTADELRVESFFPADEASAQIMQQLGRDLK